MRGIRRIARASLTLLSAATLSACLLRLETPQIDIGLEPAYNDSDITIPFRALGLPPGSILKWELSVFDGADYIYLSEQAVRVNPEDDGLISLGFLGEGQFRMVFSVITSRGSGEDEVPTLAQAHYFFVDRTPPANVAPAQFNPPFGSSASTLALDVTVDYDPANTGHPTYDPSLLSPQRVLAVVGGSIRPPVAGIDEIEGNSFRVWNANEFVPPVSVTVTWVVIDEAGNRSVLDTGGYTDP